MNLLDFLPEVIVSAVVSVAVALLIGPFRVKREEAARRDAEAHRELVRTLRSLRIRLDREIVTRKRLKVAQVERSELLSYEDFMGLAWRVVKAFDDADLNPNIRRRVRSLLERPLGAWRIEYLETLAAKPQMSDPNWPWMAFVAGQTDPRPETPLDKIVHGGESSPEEVVAVRDVIDEVLRVLGVRL